MPKTIYHLAFALMLLPATAGRTTAQIELLDGARGLSSNAVTAIIKDKRGLMWIGTQNGLNIYAGYNFTQPYLALSNEYITHLVYDSLLNILWAGTLRGLYAVTPDDGSVRHIKPAAAPDDSPVEALCNIHGDAVYVLYRNGALERVDHRYRSGRLMQLAGRKKPGALFLQGTRDRLWLFHPEMKDRLCRIHLPSGGMTYVPVPGNEYISQLAHYRDSLMILKRERRISFIQDTTSADVTPAVLSGRNVEMMALNGSKLFLIMCGSYCNQSNSAVDTLFEYDMRSGVMTPIGQHSDIFFGRQQYFCLYRDAGDIIWIGSNRGLYKILPTRHLFDTVLYDDRMRISTRTIIQEPGGDMYVGSSTGLYFYTAGTRKWVCYQYLDPETRKIPVQITDMLEDDGYLYIASLSNPVLYRFNKRSRSFETCLDGGDDDASPPYIPGLFRDKDGTIWAATNKGLMYYDAAGKKLAGISDRAWGTAPLRILNIGQGRDPETMWLATNSGAYLFHRRKGILAHFHRKSTPALSASEIYFIKEDRQGRLWLGTNGGGVNMISPDRAHIRHFSKENNGLSSNIVYGMLLQQDGKCWFSTSNGLSCYNPADDRFFNFYTTDGLCNNDFNYNSYLNGADGAMYFGSVNGLISFLPDSIRTDADRHVRLFVLPVSKWDERTKTFTLINNFRGDGDEIVLHAPSASLVFNLGLTDYRDPVHNVFTYRILGLFDDWIPLSGEPVLRLHGIPYGRYILEIKGITSRGETTANQLRFLIHVKKPFYKTAWFYLLVASALLVFISLFFRVKYRNLKRLQLLRLQISSNLHDEVGSLLTSITLFSDNLRFSGNTGPEKDARLKKIASLSREATVTMSDILWTVDVRNDAPASLSERMREYAEELLLPMQVALHVDTEDVHPHRVMPVELRQQLYLIFKEGLNNAVKHAAVTRVIITLRYHRADTFLFRIVNNGLSASRQGVQGQGLKNIRMRAGKIGADMSYEAQGDVFTLTVRKGAIT